MSKHGPVVSSWSLTDHLSLMITGKVSESSPGSGPPAPSLNVCRVDGFTEASVAIGLSVPMSSKMIGAGLISSSISVKVSVLNVGSWVTAPMVSKFVGSGKFLGNKVIVEFLLLLNFVGTNDGC